MSDPYTPPSEVDDDESARRRANQGRRPHITTIAAGVFVVIGVGTLTAGRLADGLGALMLAFSIWAIGVMVRGRK